MNMKLYHSFDLVRVRSSSCFPNHMPQKLDVLSRKHTFVGIELQDDMSQMLYHMYMVEMGFP